jgi:hypothetical protein
MLKPEDLRFGDQVKWSGDGTVSSFSEAMRQHIRLFLPPLQAARTQ